MAKAYEPARFECDPSSSTAALEWSHWLISFEGFLDEYKKANPNNVPNKKLLLINHIHHSVFSYVSECDTYEDCITALKGIYIKPKNEVFARHLLASRKQEGGESLDKFLQALKSLAKDCNFKNVTADVCRDEAIRDAFISGLASCNIRQRLLENEQLTLQVAFDQARSLDSAQKSSETYPMPDMPQFQTAAATKPSQVLNEDETNYDHANASASVNIAATKLTCFHCGNDKHDRSICPARDATCHKCGKDGHFAKVCKGKRKLKGRVAASFVPSLAATDSVFRVSAGVLINNKQMSALIDTGSSERSFIDYKLVRKYNIPIIEDDVFGALAHALLHCTAFNF